MVSRPERVVIWSVDRRESGDMVSRPERKRVVIWSVDRREWWYGQ